MSGEQSYSVVGTVGFMWVPRLIALFPLKELARGYRASSLRLQIAKREQNYKWYSMGKVR